MLLKLIKPFKTALFLLTFVLFCFNVKTASALEITAIDFNGDLLGKVIPDGKVVSFDNKLIGNVTADSLILNFDGELIGGVVPQGIAIGNDNKLLGKVNNDGSVRLASGKVVGKVLPNGLVVDDAFDIIGSVLFPGLIYSDDGKTIGRLTGDGLYTNLQGQEMGFVSADGYAYRKIGLDYVLEGRLISSKMVVSDTGSFIGSVVPGGKVTNFNAETIGLIHANGFAYNEDGKIIGSMVKNGYTFDTFGKYVGFVTYNGEVVSKGKVAGSVANQNKILDSDGNLKGFFIDFSATATDFNGKYLGRVLPNGKIAKAREVVGSIGSNGMVFDGSGNAVGQISQTGPIFDYRGELKAHALKNGSVILPEGTPLGYIKSGLAYDTKNMLIGSVLNYNPVVSNSGAFLGVPGISGSLNSTDAAQKVSPFGYVFTAEGGQLSMALPSEYFYDIRGSLSSIIFPSGETLKGEAGIIAQSGFLLGEDGAILSKAVSSKFAVNQSGDSLGYLSDKNLLLDKEGNIKAKILPDYSVVSSDKETGQSLSPKIGGAFDGNIVLGFRGEFLGFADNFGVVKNLQNSNIGKVASNDQVIDNNNSYIGRIISYDNAIDDTCEVIGVTSSKGDIRNFRDVVLGRRLLNGHVISETGDVIGHTFGRNAVVDSQGGILGTVSATGQTVNSKNDSIGCIDKRGMLKNSEGTVIGGIVAYSPVMDYEGRIIGRTILDGTVVDDDNQIIGYQQPNHNVNTKSGAPLGLLFEYRVAFDNGNKYLGRVLEDGTVVNSGGANIGAVNFNGIVTSKENEIGYALYDFYLYDNDFKTVGVINKDGNIQSLTGERLGKLDRGYLLDGDSKVSARGARDYYIRDEENNILGELMLSGELIGAGGNILGTLQRDGEILNAEGGYVARARPLQYYDFISGRQKIYDEQGELVGYLGTNDEVVDESGKVIGVLDKDGLVRSGNGNIIGGIGPDWYEKVEIAPKTPEVPQVGIVEADVEETVDKSRRSMNIALTPDGEYLGEILEDGTVIDSKGNIIGKRMPDGLVIGRDGGLIGIEEVEKPQTDGMFVPAGTFGPGAAYGTGAGAGGNLGPGGGFGPGERYDPQRAAALDAAQKERRSNMQVGKISSDYNPENFDGMQRNWNEQGIEQTISSWRVDMSEMILADKPIPAVIARSISSTNPTPVTAYVERNVYSEEGRNIIIPAGSRLIGTLGGLTAGSEATTNSAKVEITWARLIRPDGSLFMFQGLTGDAQGRGGALGYLDQQLFKKYTMPLMTTALTSYSSYIMAPPESSQGETETPRQQAANDARQNFLTQMNTLFNQILEDKTNIQPLTYVPAGTRIIIYPNVDLWLRTEERAADVAAQVDLKKKNMLIDDKETQEKLQEQNMRNQGIGTDGSGASSSSVIYEPEETDAKPAMKLIDDSKGNKKTTGAPPPPPVYTPAQTPAVAPPTSTPPSSSGSSGGSSGNSSGNSGIPQLF